MKRGIFDLSTLLFSVVYSILLLFPKQSVEGLTIGRRRILCTTPPAGAGSFSEKDAWMNPRPNLPFGLGFVGFQAFLPTLGQCPIDSQIQPPWFSGGDTIGGGFCPPEYYSLQASLPGLSIIIIALAWNSYINSNRLLITQKGIGTLNAAGAPDDAFEEAILFSQIKKWYMTPLGLVIVSSAGGNKFFPLSWDQKSVEALLEERA